MVPETDDTNPMAAFRNRVAPMPVFSDEPEALAAPELAAVAVEVAPMSEPEPTAEPVAEALPLSAPQPAPMGAAARHLLKAELVNLSPLELVERLALTLQRRSGAVISAQLPVAEPAPVAPAAAVPEPVQPAAASEPAPEVHAAPSHPRITLPAAMRPIDFRQYEQEDHLPAYVPARSIAMPPAAPAVEPKGSDPSVEAEVPRAAPQMPRFGRPAQPGEAPSSTAEEEVLEAGYSSLLDITKPAGQRQQFVRVNDPEADTDAPEPVVIFPGQAMRAGTRFAAPGQGPLAAPAAPPPSLGEMAAQPRRFDAPPVQPAPARNPEEMERALRSALSTLQRMSGAA